MKIDLFGKDIEVIQRKSEWVVFYLGNEGKKRLAHDITIPPTVAQTELLKYLPDIFHEHATTTHPSVKPID